MKWLQGYKVHRIPGVRPFGFTRSLKVPESPPWERKEEGTVLHSRRAVYLLQQQDPLRVLGQVVRGKAALDACSDHNSIPEICLSSHDATEPTEEKADKGTSRLEREEEGKVQLS